ncbi:MAG: serine/threonine protein kinase [Gammaproteobacteria bacterium]|nr:serine/threonine protein kinase [Gammaproteobacteria bacterium]
MYSFKSRAWQLGLTGSLLIFVYFVSGTAVVSNFEYSLFQYILNLQPASQTSLAELSPQEPSRLLVLFIYLLILGVYVRKFTRSKTTAVSFITLIIIAFLLLMIEILFALFWHIFLPLILPVSLMLMVSAIYWIVDIYQHFSTLAQIKQSNVSLDDVRQRIDSNDLKSAMVFLRQCPMNDDLLEVGYELGMLLESKKHWASAAYLYHWLSEYDPGLSDFVTRIEELRENRIRLLQMNKKPVGQEQTIDIIGHYQVIKKIARGATANVYEGYDLRTQNRVALKIMSSSLDEGAEGGRIKHWLHEAEIVSQMDHPNIAKIHDASIENGTPYIAMDYISGYSMALRLRKREYITVGECIRISRSVLSALAEAHKLGVVHGDIKPANIMYDNRERTYIITDFGAAYSEGYPLQGDKLIVGTPSYMSPEQLEGKKLDGRSDLFSLAVSLCHLLSGHQPFTGNNLSQLKLSIIKDEPDLSHLTLPEGLKEIILKAMQKKPYMRFADAQQMLTAVEYCENQLYKKSQR